MAAEDTAERPRTGWRTTQAGEWAAEFLGTLVLIAFGDGVVAMAVAALNQSGRGQLIFAASGDWLLIAWGWALAVTFGVYVAGGVTGAHINPAVTIALASRKDFPWRKVPGYIVAQVLGAFVGAALVYLVYHNAISSFEAANGVVRGALGGDHDSTATFSIFATFPAGYFHGNLVWPLIDQIVGTAFLLMFVRAVTDTRNQPVRANLAPWIIGLAVGAIGMSYGANAGYAINPARDFGPRMLALIAGWGKVAFPGVNGYFWVPIIGPIIGGLIGIFIYDLVIHDVLMARRTPEQVEMLHGMGRTVVDTTGAEEPDAETRPRSPEGDARGGT
ncbi:MAG TPA: MIP family channel protein [Pseudonocardiaceae bacterium]|jgi:glycerol uptake facilitator protein|nr:MIP family channel protein [Pseudonocardiaceae bacterium]